MVNWRRPKVHGSIILNFFRSRELLVYIFLDYLNFHLNLSILIHKNILQWPNPFDLIYKQSLILFIVITKHWSVIHSFLYI